MTFPDTITPHTDTETAPQSCGDDPFGLDQIPAFLRRAPGDTRLHVVVFHEALRPHESFVDDHIRVFGQMACKLILHRLHGIDDDVHPIGLKERSRPLPEFVESF